METGFFDLGAAPKCSSSVVQQQRSVAEPLSELLERCTGGGRGYLGVDLHRECDLAVPKDLHGDAGVNLKGGQQRSACPAGAVHCDLGNPGLCDATVEAAVEVARLDRCAVAGGEHQAGFGPCIVSMIAVSVLLLSAELKRGDAQVRQGEGCPGCVGLGLAAQELAADALELLGHIQLAGE